MRQYMYTCTYSSRRRLRALGSKGKRSPWGMAHPEPITANASRSTTK